MNVAERIAENAKNANIAEVAGFTKSMPQGFDADGVLEVGDVILMPATMPKVYSQKFGTRADGSANTGEFIVVEVRNAAGAIRAINFFPSSLTKNIWKAEKAADGSIKTITAGGPLNPKGTVVDLYRSFQGKGTATETDVQLGINALLGKELKITGKTPVDVQAWSNGAPTNALRKSNLFTYDF